MAGFSSASGGGHRPSLPRDWRTATHKQNNRTTSIAERRWGVPEMQRDVRDDFVFLDI